jgi:hypothetical protein
MVIKTIRPRRLPAVQADRRPRHPHRRRRPPPRWDPAILHRARSVPRAPAFRISLRPPSPMPCKLPSNPEIRRSEIGCPRGRAAGAQRQRHRPCDSPAIFGRAIRPRCSSPSPPSWRRERQCCGQFLADIRHEFFERCDGPDRGYNGSTADFYGQHGGNPAIFQSTGRRSACADYGHVGRVRQWIPIQRADVDRRICLCTRSPGTKGWSRGMAIAREAEDAMRNRAPTTTTWCPGGAKGERVKRQAVRSADGILLLSAGNAEA